MSNRRSFRGAVLLVLVTALAGSGCWGRSFFRAPAATLDSSAKIDSLLDENALMRQRLGELERQVREMRDYDRGAAARSQIDVEEIKDGLNALRQMLSDAGQAATPRSTRPGAR